MIEPTRTGARPKGKSTVEVWEALKKLDRHASCECRFDWLFLPRSDERRGALSEIFDALIDDWKSGGRERHPKKADCRLDEMLSDARIKGPSRIIEADFYLPSFGMMVEFDERQHFSAERGVTLEFYDPKEFSFDVRRWRDLCREIEAIDIDPPWRDWARAYRDTVRDFAAKNQGLRMLHLYDGDFRHVKRDPEALTKKLQQCLEI